MLNRINREPLRLVAQRDMPRHALPRHKRVALGVALVGALGMIGFVNTKTVGQAVTHIEAEKPVVSRPCGEVK